MLHVDKRLYFGPRQAVQLDERANPLILAIAI